MINRLIFLVISLSLFCMTASAKTTPVDCQHHPLYCHILTLQPNIDKPWAMNFSNLLFRYSKRHQLDPWISLAIAMQESSLKKNQRKIPVLIQYQDCQTTPCQKKLRLVQGISDIGLFQLHVNTIKKYHLGSCALAK